ncbi:MAG: penicillin acylase family protein, partial [Pseudomonadota bacterium]
MTLTRKVLLGALALVVLVVLLIIGLVLWVLSPDADYTLTLRSETISAPVDIYRDETGVPHIYAENYKDAAFATGYVQGQDRGWQMESLRRAVEGRTSEFLGGLTIDLDKQFLAAGVSRLADLSLSEYDDDTREILQAYVNGVNASIEAGEYQASPEFRLFRVEAEPWTLRQAGSLPYIIGGMFEAGGLRELRARTLTSDLGEERARMIVRDFETTWPTLFRDVGALDTVSAKTIAALEEAGLPLSARASIPTGSFTEGEEEGTNFFVLGPEKTTTGGAILAIDPHLEHDAPNLYYPVSITLPDQIIRGAAWITTPSIHFGHNSNIAFGMTAMVVDHRHLVVEKIDPDDPASYIRPEGSFKFELVEYDIPVRGQDEPEKFTVRYTQDGPVVSDHFEQMTELAAEYGPGYVIVDKSAVRGKG